MGDRWKGVFTLFPFMSASPLPAGTRHNKPLRVELKSKSLTFTKPQAFPSSECMYVCMYPYPSLYVSQESLARYVDMVWYKEP